MNLILFEPDETLRPLPRSDRRARHVLEILRRQVGDAFDVGLVNGPRGRATFAGLDQEFLTLTFDWGPPPPPLDAITLIVGLPRPQTARDILRDATTLGVSAIHFVCTGKSEASYAQSTLWSSGEWRRHLVAGAEQAFDTRIPHVTHGRTLAEVLAAERERGTRLALDNYESAQLLGAQPQAIFPVTLALGAERGWSAAERVLLRTQGFEFVHLGTRVLRAETAVAATLAIVRSHLGLM